MFLRKKKAGSTSLGHTWDEDGAVVEVPDEHGHLLLRILDGGFEAVDHLLHRHEGEGSSVIEPGPASTLTEGGDGGGDPLSAPEGAGDDQTLTDPHAEGGEDAGGNAEGAGDGAPPNPDADATATPAKRAPAKAAKAAAPAKTV